MKTGPVEPCSIQSESGEAIIVVSSGALLPLDNCLYACRPLFRI